MLQGDYQTLDLTLMQTIENVKKDRFDRGIDKDSLYVEVKIDGEKTYCVYNVKSNTMQTYENKYEFISDDNLFNYQAKIIRDLAESQNCIIIGRCGDYVLRNDPKAIRIFVCADEEACVNKVVELYGLDADDAKKKIDKIDKSRAAYYKYYTGKEWNDPVNYDLCINTTTVGFEGAVDIIMDYMKRKGIKVD